MPSGVELNKDILEIIERIVYPIHVLDVHYVYARTAWSKYWPGSSEIIYEVTLLSPISWLDQIVIKILERDRSTRKVGSRVRGPLCLVSNT